MGEQKYDLYQVIQVLMNNGVTLDQIGRTFVSAVASQRTHFTSRLPLEEHGKKTFQRAFQAGVRDFFYSVRNKMILSGTMPSISAQIPIPGAGQYEGIEAVLSCEEDFAAIGEKVLAGAKHYHQDPIVKRRNTAPDIEYLADFAKEYRAIMRALTE